MARVRRRARGHALPERPARRHPATRNRKNVGSAGSGGGNGPAGAVLVSLRAALFGHVLGNRGVERLERCTPTTDSVVEALERFVGKEPLRRVHECVFGVLAMETGAADPRL